MASSVADDNSVEDAETESDTCSAINNGSVVSTIPDRYGFLGGAQYSQDSDPAVSLAVIRKRELKWIEMLENWDRYMTKKYKKVRERCRKGIPSSMRARAWSRLCGGHMLMQKDRDMFHKLVSQPGNPQWIDEIEKDLHRQFPLHEMFMDKGGYGQEDLAQVLKAYTILNPEEGYCQAHAPIAALLLMHMPAEQAFWCLVSICDQYLPGYYSKGMEAIQIDGDILFGLLKRVSPSIYKHMKKQKIEPILYMTEWFLCAFTRTLSWSAVLRVWDMFLCEGVKVLFRVGLVLLKASLGQPGVLKKCPTMYETLQTIRDMRQDLLTEDVLVYHMLKLSVTEDDMQREHQKQVAKRQAAQGNDKKKKR